MGVEHHSPKCLIEHVAHGPTVAKVLAHMTRENKAQLLHAEAEALEHQAAVATGASGGGGGGGGAGSIAPTPLLRRTLETLVEFHRAVLDAFVHDGLLHSDIHLGNVIQEARPLLVPWATSARTTGLAQIRPSVP